MGSRADRWLRKRFPGMSRRHVEEALVAGLARHTSGRKAKKGDTVDSLDVSALEVRIARLGAGTPGIEVPVLQEGEGWVAVDKPAGLDGHPLSLFDERTLTHWALNRWPEVRSQFPELQPTMVPHRLDRDTSGVQIVARTANAYQMWRSYFGAGKILKRYLAWVWGEPKEDRWQMNRALAHDPSDDRRMVLVGESRHRPPVLEALTKFQVLDRREGCALVEATCFTGVTHQVRVHAAGAGCPLVGDVLYDRLAGTRTLEVSHHRLRAICLESPLGSVEAPSEEFRKGP